jgi:hypothetical protein
MIWPIFNLAFFGTVYFFQTSGAFFGIAGSVACTANCLKIYLEVIWHCGYCCKLSSNIYSSSKGNIKKKTKKRETTLVFQMVKDLT